MLTTWSCREQLTACRDRFQRSALKAVTGLTGLLIVATPAASRADALQAWAGPVPPLSLKTIDRNSVALDDFRGRIAIIHFFATWCEPCRPELEALDRFRSSDIGRDISIIAIDVGEPEVRVVRYFERHPVGFQIALDQDQGAAKAWGVFAFPSSFVLDRALNPVWQAAGDVPWDDPAIRRLIADLAQTSPAPNPSRPD